MAESELEKLRSAVLNLAETDYDTSNFSDYHYKISEARKTWTDLYGYRDFDDPEWGWDEDGNRVNCTGIPDNLTGADNTGA